MTPEKSTPETEDGPADRFLRPQLLFVLVSLVFIAGFWIWFIFMRVPDEVVEKELIEGRASGEIVAACNAAATAAGVSEPFRPEDVKTHGRPLAAGVAAFVSALEVSRNGVACRWDGVNPARLFRP
jgi:hypothetical protein